MKVRRTRKQILLSFKTYFLHVVGRLSRFSVHHSINFSLFRLFSIKTQVLAFFVVSKLLTERKSYRALRGTKLATGEFGGKIALIVANGPSSKDVNWAVVDRERQNGNCFLFLINHSINDPKVRERGADFLVLSDPGSHPHSTDPRTIDLWANLLTIPELQLITPVSWHASDSAIKCEIGKCFHFSDLSLESIRTSTSPLKPRGYPSLTAYKALAFAKHLGFETILVAGFDNSMFRTLQVDSANSLIQTSNHFTDGYSPTINISAIYPNGIADYFAELSEMFLSLRRSFKGTKIYNLGLQSEVDAFPKATRDTLWSEFTIRPD
jgi:hypothetical protein